MKKLLSSLIVLLLLVACCLIAAFPTSATDINYADYDIIDGVILEYLGNSEANIVIPAEDENGQAITQISDRAFREHEEINTVVIPEGIETLGAECFEYCRQLAEVSLPYSLQEAGYSLFRGTNILSITIPGQLTIIRPDFVVGKLTELFISPGVEEIHTAAFYGSLSSEIIFPKSVYMIRGAFWNMLYVDVKDVTLYILNDDCELGEVVPGDQFYKSYGSPSAIINRAEGNKAKIKIYGLRDSAIKDYVDTYMNDGMTRFLPLDKEEIDEYEAKAEATGITKSTVDEDKEPDEDEDPDDKGSSKNNKNNKDDKDDNGTTGANNGISLDPTLLLIIGGGFLLFIIIIVVVLVLVLTLGKKKKKKKKKKVAKAPEEATTAEETAPVVEETAEVVEEVAEEQGEEE